MVREFNIARLSFASGTHLGSGIGKEYDRSMRAIHSDTISAALCSVWATMGSDVESFLHSYRVSSAMPMYRGRLFLPLPLDKSCISLTEDPNGTQHKRLKRLQWIEQPLWERLSREGRIEITSDMISHCGSAIVASDASTVHIQHQALEQKVRVVEGEDNEPYFFDRIFWGKDVELVVFYESSRQTDFQQSFIMLSESGFGTRRSVGNGIFDVAFDTAKIDVDESAEGAQLLSLWHPKREEWSAATMSKSCYSLISRGGFISGSSDVTQRNRVKKSVNMIMAGSVITTPSLVGDVVDVRPDGFTAHPVWRDGRAFYLPFVKPYEDEV